MCPLLKLFWNFNRILHTLNSAIPTASSATWKDSFIVSHYDISQLIMTSVINIINLTMACSCDVQALF